jgi:hypothetical protein
MTPERVNKVYSATMRDFFVALLRKPATLMPGMVPFAPKWVLVGLKSEIFAKRARALEVLCDLAVCYLRIFC